MTSVEPCQRGGAGTWTGVVAVAALAFAACSGHARARRTFEFRGPTMGTTWSVKVVTGSEGLGGSVRAELDQAIRRELDRINRLMSTWDPESELSRFNRAPSLERFPVAPETFEVFQWAQRLAGETGGALDVTVGSLVDAWGFGAAGDRGAPPNDEELVRLRAATGMEHLELDPDGRWVQKRRPDVRCDFSALAPGYAAERLAAMLERHGLSDFLVDVGGEFVARGSSDRNEPWHVAVEEPGAERRRVARRIIPLTNMALATSGDYRNYREVNGERLPHILDPRTGHPVRHALASVTVIDATGVRADGLSTALMVLGPEDGMALAKRLDLSVLFIVRTPDGGFEERVSPRFEALARD